MNNYDGKSSFYGKLPEVYDLFFLQNIDEQVSYLIDIISSCRLGRRCLDVGCGTGACAERLGGNGLDILALDLSADMLRWAKGWHSHPSVRYIQADMTKFHTEEKYDFAIAMSHVIGYQWQNAMVEAMLQNIHDSLGRKGVFMFNFYHAPAVSNSRLRSKFKQVSNDSIAVSRISNAKNNPMENVLEGEYYYLIEEASGVSSISIQEKIRYFSLLEIEYFLEKTGFNIEKKYNYLTRDQLTADDWNGFIIARRTD